MIEHGQRVCKLTFDRMLEAPDVLYGSAIGSSYQHQEETLGQALPASAAARRRVGRGPADGQQSFPIDAKR